ncbi:putative aldehyde dehydrogenase (NAD(P)(+)) [Rosa chinensis]|uniref:Putative aldehyde dehydrogenase (NAD(P)(+)) n=1 Tax=Rosa chinensis TaxID=74649 RepID=A0A2P6RGC2_ROSCH|nr:putative aldehyde dehydrogenase (NAD(P)(+)) [Rosa chinensis]
MIVDKKQFEKILTYIEQGKREGETLLTGGKPVGKKGYYIEPTVFTDVKDDMLIAKDEIFGPVMSLMKFNQQHQVWPSCMHCNQERHVANTVSRSIRAGIIWINCYFAFDRDCPYGGYKMTGFGRYFGTQGLHKYLHTRGGFGLVWFGFRPKLKTEPN